MFREYRRKWVRKNRFRPWYRQCRHYLSKRGEIGRTIKTFCGDLGPLKQLRLRTDMIWSLFCYGAYFSEYFLFGFEGKPRAYRNSFITEANRMHYYPLMNDPRNTDLLENKYRAYLLFRELYGREMLYVRRGAQAGEEELRTLTGFAARHENYIVKPVYAAFGRGVHSDSLTRYASAAAAFAAYAEKGAVLEERILQDPRMAAIHPASVNTLRIPTVILSGRSGTPELRLFHPSLRTGRGGSLTDNFSAGGISALIDPDSGLVFTDGADKRGGRWERHPDSGIRFRGFQIPEWDRAVALVRRAALSVPGNHYCGWDLALSADCGWCIVEANSTAQMGAMQIVTRTGRRAELEALIRQMK